MRVPRTYDLTVQRETERGEEEKEVQSRRLRRGSVASRRGAMGAFTSVENKKASAVVINIVLLVASLILIGTGASLMGFYRIQMLEVITIDFVIVPTVLTGGGIFTMLVAVFGVVAVAKEDACLTIVYSILVAVDVLILLGGIVSSVRLLFDIQVGFLNADVIPELSSYETDTWVQYKWDTIQREFTCCGGYGYAQGYTDWKHTSMGGARNSVPDSCCLHESHGCGVDLFKINNLRVIVLKINVHGCLAVMQRRLETHVTLILMVFAGVGSVLAVVELLAIVLACCLASSFSGQDDYDCDYEYGNR